MRLGFNLFPTWVILKTSLKGPLTQQQSNSQSKKSYNNECLTSSADPRSCDNKKKELLKATLLGKRLTQEVI